MCTVYTLLSIVWSLPWCLTFTSAPAGWPLFCCLCKAWLLQAAIKPTGEFYFSVYRLTSTLLPEGWTLLYLVHRLVLPCLQNGHPPPPPAPAAYCLTSNWCRQVTSTLVSTGWPLPCCPASDFYLGVHRLTYSPYTFLSADESYFSVSSLTTTTLFPLWFTSIYT
jgi:hypothetical protein